MPLGFRVDGSLSTNLATTWMVDARKKTDTDTIYFNKEGLMGMHVGGGDDDSKMPDQNQVIRGPKILYRWVACKGFGPYGHIMDILMWVVGGEPQNPTCYAVSFKRV